MVFVHAFILAENFENENVSHKRHWSSESSDDSVARNQPVVPNKQPKVEPGK